MRNQLFKIQIIVRIPTSYICDMFDQAIGKQSILVFKSKKIKLLY